MCAFLYDDYTGNVVIPETVTYNGTTYSVTSIGEKAFYNCKSLKNIRSEWNMLHSVLIIFLG